MKKAGKILGTVLLAAIVMILACNRETFRLDLLLQWQPSNRLLAAAVLLLCYCIKGLLVFVPITVLQIVVGHLFPPVSALLLNTAGLAAVLSVPYWIGSAAGPAKVEKLIHRYSKVGEILEFGKNNQWIACFLLRACAVPPADVLTACLGAVGADFRANVLGGMMGCLPSMVLTTFLGASIQESSSPEFWLALGLNVLWAAVSTLSYYLFRRSQRKKEGANP